MPPRCHILLSFLSNAHIYRYLAHTPKKILNEMARASLIQQRERSSFYYRTLKIWESLKYTFENVCSFLVVLAFILYPHLCTTSHNLIVVKEDIIREKQEELEYYFYRDRLYKNICVYVSFFLDLLNDNKKNKNPKMTRTAMAETETRMINCLLLPLAPVEVQIPLRQICLPGQSIFPLHPVVPVRETHLLLIHTSLSRHLLVSVHPRGAVPEHPIDPPTTVRTNWESLDWVTTL